MSRRAHMLQPNKEVVLPNQALFIDAEAEEIDLEDGRIELVRTVAWAAYWRKSEKGVTRKVKWVKIEDLDAFWDWVERLARPKWKLYIFAHNCYVDFSWLKGFSQLTSRGWTPTPPYVYGMSFIAKWQKDKQRIVLLDTTNYFHTSVEKLGETFGIAKQGKDGKPFPGVSWDDYCKRDVEIIMTAMQTYWEFIREYNLGGFAPTASSQAMKAYRHRFMPLDLWIHADDRKTHLERLSYHGGRCECFYQGELTDGPYYKLDFNSAYASAMYENTYPCGDFGYRKHPTMEDLKRYLPKRAVIARVLIDTDQPVYSYRLNGKLVFPVGSFETTLTSRELEYALAHNHIAEVREMAIYPKRKLFKTFVSAFYKLRLKYQKEGNKAYAMLAKLYINSLYGKWGQRNIKREILDDCPIDEAHSEPYMDLTTKKQGVCYHYGGLVYAETKEGEGYNAFAAISSHIAADVRMKLWEMMELAGEGHYFYCDTDSLWVDQVGYERLEAYISDNRLGFFKVEDVTPSVAINAPKDYRFGDTVKIKGIPKGSVEVGPGEFKVNIWQGFRGAMQRGELGRVIIKPTLKRLARRIEKGELLSTGQIVPYHLTYGELTAEIADRDTQAILDLELETFSGIKQFSQTLVFTVWDYKEGDFRHGVDNLATAPHYRGIPLDVVAAENGFEDYNNFLRAIEGQVETDRQIKSLKQSQRR